ncbi:hypothetical protein [Ramlibacter sp. AN1133]|uniref:hypothetical protein n=1 Tax=Ramlibacter sp. AN1133 TaxID=3133429 RepID=UPI0030BC0D67
MTNGEVSTGWEMGTSDMTGALGMATSAQFEQQPCQPVAGGQPASESAGSSPPADRQAPAATAPGVQPSPFQADLGPTSTATAQAGTEPDSEPAAAGPAASGNALAGDAPDSTARDDAEAAPGHERHRTSVRLRTPVRDKSLALGSGNVTEGIHIAVEQQIALGRPLDLAALGDVFHASAAGDTLAEQIELALVGRVGLAGGALGMLSKKLGPTLTEFALELGEGDLLRGIARTVKSCKVIGPVAAKRLSNGPAD